MLLRPKGPVVCLAQPNGLGSRYESERENQRPGHLSSFAWFPANCRAFGPPFTLVELLVIIAIIGVLVG